MQSMQSFLISVMRGDNRLMFFGFLIHAFVSGFFTFRGLSLDADGFMETAAFSVFAIAAGVLIFLFWHFALLVVPTFKKPHQIAMGWFTVFFGVFLIIWASCMPNFTAAAGRLAKEHHLKHYVSQNETFLGEQYQNAMMMEVMANLFDGHRDRYNEYAKREYSSGVFSGSKGGSGAVHLSLISTRDRMGAMADLSRNHVTTASESYDAASKSIGEMRATVLTEKSLSERSRLVAVESDKAFKALTAMNPMNLAESFLRTAQSLPDELVVPQTLSRSADIAKKQAEAIVRLREDITRTATNISDTATDIIADSDKTLERFDPMSASKTARVYWQEYTPHLIAAFAIDLFPLCILLFLTATMGVKSEQEIAAMEFKAMTLEQIYRASLAKDIIRNPTLNPRGIELLTSAMVGDLDNGDQS